VPNCVGACSPVGAISPVGANSPVGAFKHVSSASQPQLQVLQFCNVSLTLHCRCEEQEEWAEDREEDNRDAVPGL